MWLFVFASDFNILVCYSMMLLAKMEDCSSLFPSLCMEDAFQTFDNYDNGLYGRKKKKRESVDVAECRLDSPCNSPEVIMSGGMEDNSKVHHKLLLSDSFSTAQDSADYDSMFGGVDMEGFYRISASMTAGEDIMLSSSAKESKLVLKEVAARHELLKQDVLQNCSSADDSHALQSQFEADVDGLLDNCLSKNRAVSLPSPACDLLPVLSEFVVSGYLLSDIPSHPDLSGEAGESVDSLITYCSDKDERSNTCSTVPRTKEKKENLLNSIKCEDDICHRDTPDTVYDDFDALCANTLLDNMQSHMNDRPNTSSCQQCGCDCLCYKSDTSSAEEDDVCIEYFVSRQPARVRRARERCTRVPRRGPGRPRKLQNVDCIRRGPGRPRKKSVSDAVAWYQSRRKRTVSLSNGYKCRNKQTPLSDVTDAYIVNKRPHESDAASDRALCRKRSRRRDAEVQSTESQPVFAEHQLSSVQSIETGASMLYSSIWKLFLPRDTMLSAVYAVDVSVCLCVSVKL